jgi:hypothetical protein
LSGWFSWSPRDRRRDRVLANGGHTHAVTHFAVFGYHVTGSTGTLFLYGIVTGALAMLGLSLLLAGARRASRRGRDARRGLARSRRLRAARPRPARPPRSSPGRPRSDSPVTTSTRHVPPRRLNPGGRATAGNEEIAR